MDKETKTILTSKTFWVNFLTVGVVLLNRNEQVVDPALIEPLALVVLPFANIVLRMITTKPVSVRKPKQ
jgi:hypothetical protein